MILIMIVSATSCFWISQWIIRIICSSNKAVKDGPLQKGSWPLPWCNWWKALPSESCTTLPWNWTWALHNPLFIFKDGCLLTRQRFGHILNTLLSRLGYDSTLHNVYSCHIGAVTTARQANIPDSSIKCWVDGRAMLISLTSRLLHKNSLAFQSIWLLDTSSKQLRTQYDS